MKRLLMEELLKWKNKSDKSPLILLGARQVGKTYLLEDFAKQNYKEYIYINFENQPEYKDIYTPNLDPKRILEEIELMRGKKIDPKNELIFFDEIQQESKAITSLKYFKEQKPEYDIVCAGSLLGVMINRSDLSFPVGKVEFKYLYPFSFEEFLMGINEEILIPKIRHCFSKNEQMPEIVHQKLIDIYKRYLCIGGMPRAINNYIENDKDLLKFDREIHENIINSYIADMGKYSGNNDTVKIQAIYKSIVEQLSRENKKFKYSTVSKGGRASQFESSIEWLISSRINLICECIKHIDFPLSGFKEEGVFKIYMSDVGLLNTMGRIPYKVMLAKEHHIFKGAMTENYIASELRSKNHDLYYYRKNEIEVDFIVQINDEIIPIEVKSSENTRSRSLNSYIEKYKPKYAIKISTKNFGLSKNNVKSIPLYATFCI